MARLFVGSYASGEISSWMIDPESGGIWAAGIDSVKADGPAYLAARSDGSVLYCVSEIPQGQVRAFRVDRTTGRLDQLGEVQATGGGEPCHLSLTPDERHLVCANYMTGSLSLHPLATDGAIGPLADLAQAAGTGPDTQRQEGPHMHMAFFADPLLIATDLGTDTLRTYTVNAALHRFEPVAEFPLPAGSGPRHLVMAATGLTYVAGELDSSVTTVRLVQKAARAEIVGRTASTIVKRSAEVRNYPSAIRLSEDERFLYVANRGFDTVSVFSLAGGDPTPLCEVRTGGRWPQDLILWRDFLYVANQHSDKVDVFRVNRADGALVRNASLSKQVPSPASLLIL